MEDQLKLIHTGGCGYGIELLWKSVSIYCVGLALALLNLHGCIQKDVAELNFSAQCGSDSGVQQ